MLYDGRNPLHVEQARQRVEKFKRNGSMFELTEKRPGRTRSQNSYLHLILGWFALETGNTLEWVKREYYKRLVNPSVYIRWKDDRFLGRVEYIRSSRELDTAEMSRTIDRFRQWSEEAAGIRLPSPDDRAILDYIEMEINRNKEYLNGDK